MSSAPRPVHEQSLRQHSNGSDLDREFWIDAVDDVLIVAVTDAAGTILYANAKFCDISGYARSELIGANHRILNSGAHDRSFFENMFRTLRGGRSWRGEICNRAKNGSLYWVDTTIIPYFDSSRQVTRYVACRFDITRQKEAQEQLHCMASVDPLTGLLNRTAFHTLATRALQQTGRQGGAAAIVLGLDNFKDINDIHGYTMGDAVIRTVAERIQGAVRPTDMVSRLGGDEFALLLQPCPTPRCAEQLLHGIRLALRRPLALGIAHKTVSASLGVAMLSGDQGTMAELLRDADTALCVAKSAGRDCWVFFAPEMRESTSQRIRLQDQARSGLSRGEFELFYQPLINLADGRLHSFEALLRWDHPEHGLLAPGRFGEIFQDHRIASSVGLYVQRRALAQIREWRQSGIAFGKIAINTTSADFMSTAFVDHLLTAMRHGRLQTSDISIEVTEGMFLGKGAEAVRQEIDRLHAAGFEIAFDDFGTGFASLTHLKELPLDRLKIDRSFVQDLETDSSDQKIVRGIIDLAHSLDLSVTAEGIETAAQLEILRGMGCDRMQGYLVSRPVSAVEVPGLVQRLARGRACWPRIVPPGPEASIPQGGAEPLA